MSRPGDRLHRLATRVCSDRTRRRLIDPAVADLQAEVSAARRTGSRWHTLRALAAGYLSIVKVLVIAACGDLRADASTWQPEERAGARHGAFVAIITIVVTTGLLVAMALLSMGITGDWMQLATYMVPSSLALTIPLGLVLGVAWMCHGAARTRRLAVGVVVFAALCSVATFANLAWLTPEANQAYRKIVFARLAGSTADRPLARGLNELTLPAMRARLEEFRTVGPARDARQFETAYYQRLALGVAALPMVGVVLALAYRRRWGRARLTVAALGLSVGYYAALVTSPDLGESLGVPPIVIGWAATAVCAAAVILIRAANVRPPRARPLA